MTEHIRIISKFLYIVELSAYEMLSITFHDYLYACHCALIFNEYLLQLWNNVTILLQYWNKVASCFRALSLSEDVDTVELAGTFYFNLGHTQKAAKLFSSLLQKQPDNLQANIYYVSIFVLPVFISLDTTQHAASLFAARPQIRMTCFYHGFSRTWAWKG